MASAREVLLGPAYFHHRRLIEKSKSWSPEQIQQYQQARAGRLVRRYGDRVTQKADYRQNLGRYTRWDVPLLTHTVRTGGTSGQPLRFQADTFARRQKERAYLFDIWSQVGYAPHDLRVCYRGEIHGGPVRFSRLENSWLISPAATLHHQLGKLRRWIRDMPPFFLHVYPSSLITFIDLVGEELFRALPVRAVLAGSEVFPAGEQERFEREFGIRVAHWYGHSEYAVLAYCCRECCGFHFYPTYGQVELLASEAEGAQRIVATSFNRIATQFVRYDTGDLAAAPTGSCSANHFPRVDTIVGRSQETFVDTGGRRRALGPYLFGIHGPFWDKLRDLQVVQDHPGRLLVRLAADPGVDKDLVRLTLQRRMPMVELDFEYVPVIDRSRSGKRRYFVDSLQAPTPAAPASHLIGMELPGQAPGPLAHPWPAVAAVVLAVAVAAMVFLAVVAGGGHRATPRAHRRDAIVNVAASPVRAKASRGLLVTLLIRLPAYQRSPRSDTESRRSAPGPATATGLSRLVISSSPGVSMGAAELAKGGLWGAALYRKLGCLGWPASGREQGPSIWTLLEHGDTAAPHARHRRCRYRRRPGRTARRTCLPRTFRHDGVCAGAGRLSSWRCSSSPSGP
jgi:phenylacetate-CoA ligase